MKLNTNIMWLWLFLVSTTLAVGQNTAPCPVGSGPGGAGPAGQSSASGRPASPASTNTASGSATPPAATAAPAPGLAASTPSTATTAPGSAMPLGGAATTQARNIAPRPRTVGSQRGLPSAQMPNRASSGAATTASLNSTSSPCTPSSNGAGALPPTTGPQN
jgi:hypothetical protein